MERGTTEEKGRTGSWTQAEEQIERGADAQEEEAISGNSSSSSSVRSTKEEQAEGEDNEAEAEEVERESRLDMVNESEASKVAEENT